MAKKTENRAAIARHKTSSSSRSWDGPANEARLRTDQPRNYYARAFAWEDLNGNPRRKNTYRFIHHEVTTAGNPGAANTRALITGIAVLNGARGGTTIPESDRQGVWDHLAKHLRDAGQDPPDLRAMGAQEQRGRNLSGRLNDLIEEQISEDNPRSDIVTDLASGAGIEEDTVNSILDGSIDCPPLERLRAFARVLGTTLSSLQGAAERDGCDYDRSGRTACCGNCSEGGACETHQPARSKFAPERRTFDGDELRVVTDKGAPVIEGYAAVFDSESVPMMGFVETIKRGAFKKTLQEADIRGLYNHDPNFVLGRNKAGTLELQEDRKGLLYRLNPPNTEWANGLIESIKRRDISGSSFGFNTVKDEWDHDADPVERSLVEVRLFDVGPVTFPAYESSESHVRALSCYAGVDCDALHQAVRKSMRGIKVSDEERTMLCKYTDFLRRCTDQEPAGSHSSDPAGNRQSLGIMRNKLDLLRFGS